MPGDYERSPKEYLSRVSQNENIDIGARLNAAREFGSINMAESLGQYQYLFRITLSYEDAIEQYSLAYQHIFNFMRRHAFPLPF